MKKERQRKGRPARKPAAARTESRKPVDLRDIREQITNLVGNDAIVMVETTIEEVGKGHSSRVVPSRYRQLPKMTKPRRLARTMA
jgi:hypothetical protein